MRLFSLTIPEPLEAAVGACRRRFAMAAGFSALLTVILLAPTIDTVQVYDRVVPIGSVLTFLWITVTVGLVFAALTALDTVQTGSGSGVSARAQAARVDPRSGAQAMRAWVRGQGIEP